MTLFFVASEPIFNSSDANKNLRKDPPPLLRPTSKQDTKQEKKEDPKKELMCPICRQIMKDAVIANCCNESFCNDCESLSDYQCFFVSLLILFFSFAL
jgi:hypothetical protein